MPMRVPSIHVTLLALALGGCPNGHSQQSDSRSEPMQPGFAKAKQSFADYTAQSLGVKAQKITVGPSDEAIANYPQNHVGNLWRFEGTYTYKPTEMLDPGQKTVRAWASPDGTIVTLQQNLGLLFEEAGVWTATPKLTADAHADKIAWTATSSALSYFSPTGASLDLSGGAGSFRFRVSARQSGPGGAGGGPVYLYDCTVALTADHKATLAFSDNLNK
jgi:hypothetical protein